LDHASSIFWNPDQMILKSMLCMGSSGVSGHSQIMPDLPPLRQPELASFRVPFIPRLKPGVYWLFLLLPLQPRQPLPGILNLELGGVGVLPKVEELLMICEGLEIYLSKPILLKRLMKRGSERTGSNPW
jgi:hypothetical protein